MWFHFLYVHTWLLVFLLISPKLLSGLLYSLWLVMIGVLNWDLQGQLYSHALYNKWDIMDTWSSTELTFHHHLETITSNSDISNKQLLLKRVIELKRFFQRSRRRSRTAHKIHKRSTFCCCQRHEGQCLFCLFVFFISVNQIKYNNILYNIQKRETEKV